MGCDIHCYLERIYQEDDGSIYVDNIADVYLGRNYLLFGYMAGVRSYVDPVVDPRGLPNNMSYGVESENTLLVLPDNEYHGQEKCCSLSDATKWVQNGPSEWVGNDKKRVTHPDWHSHSWMNVDELRQVQKEYSENEEYQTMVLELGDPIPEGFELSALEDEVKIVDSKDPLPIGKYETLEGVIAMMDAINDGDISRTRLVFWFDS